MKEATKAGSKITVSLVPTGPEGKAQEIQDVECLLWAIGRDANMVGLGIESTGVEINKKGFITVDEYQNTNVKNLYALGDIAGNKLLTPGMCLRICVCVFVCMCSCNMHPWERVLPNLASEKKSLFRNSMLGAPSPSHLQS